MAAWLINHVQCSQHRSLWQHITPCSINCRTIVHHGPMQFDIHDAHNWGSHITIQKKHHEIKRDHVDVASQSLILRLSNSHYASHAAKMIDRTKTLQPTWARWVCPGWKEVAVACRTHSCKHYISAQEARALSTHAWYNEVTVSAEVGANCFKTEQKAVEL